MLDFPLMHSSKNVLEHIYEFQNLLAKTFCMIHEICKNTSCTLVCIT